MQLHHFESGSGPPLLLIHGLFDSLKTWKRLIPNLSGQYKLYAIDLPGFGNSPLPKEWRESISGLVNAVLAFLDQKHLERVSLLGNSMGGGIALALSERQPERVDQIVLLNPYGLPSVPLAVKSARRPLIGALLPYFLRNATIKQCARGIFSRSLYNQDLLSEQMIEALVQPFSCLRKRKDLFRFLRAISPGEIDSIDSKLSEIEQRVLILWGQKDGWLSKEHWMHLESRLPNSKTIQIPACGHLPQLEKPKEVAAQIISFLENQW